MENWLHDNMHGILIFIEVLWVAGFFSVFLLYFVLRWHLKKKRKEEQSQVSLERPEETEVKDESKQG